MAWGPGKYDEACTVARLSTKARAALLIIIDGNLGSGFSVQTEPTLLLHLPKLLRDIADQIETSQPGG